VSSPAVVRGVQVIGQSVHPAKLTSAALVRGIKLAEGANLSDPFQPILGSTFPDISIEVAFDSNPNDPVQAWTAITNKCRSFSTGPRGRRPFVDRTETAPLSLEIDNSDRAFDPTNAAGPYYGKLKPNKRVRIRARWNGVIYPILDAMVNEWPQSWSSAGLFATVKLQAADRFKTLGQFDLPADYTRQVELSGAAIEAILDAANQPSGDRNIAAGKALIEAINPPSPDTEPTSPGKALEVAQKVADSERGLFFSAADGRWTFQDRTTRLNQTPQGVFGDAAGELPYMDAVPAFTDQDIANDVHVSLPDGSEQIASDATSQAENGAIISLSIDTMLHDPNDAQSIALFELSQRKEARTRIDSFVLDGSTDPANLWPVILGMEISDRYTFKRRPPGGGDPQVYEINIESIAFQGKPGQLRATVQAAPANTGKYWQLGQSRLGSETRLSF
jgi:hypothetical protein